MKGHKHPPALLLLVMLCCTAAASAAAVVAQPDAEDKASLEQEAAKLRADVERQPGNAMLQLQLATTLHKLNHLSPDGGRRIPEAAKAYRYDAACICIQAISNPGYMLATARCFDCPDSCSSSLQAVLVASACAVAWVWRC